MAVEKKEMATVGTATAAKDSGGYEVLDIIFDIKPTALLTMRKEEMKDDSVILRLNKKVFTINH